MNYTETAFPIFFALTFALYYTMRSAGLQVLVLVGASLVFYAWTAPLILAVFLCSWAITGLTSYQVLHAPTAVRRKAAATAGVAANLLILGFFKYKFLFLPTGLHGIGAPENLGQWLLFAPLPIGISFYTFHGISLLIDVFRNNRHIARDPDAVPGLATHLGNTLLYLVFFPQLIAGPIIKARDFFPQVARKRLSDIAWDPCARLLILGYFLKSVVADNLSEQTFWIAYPHFLSRSSVDLWLMLFGYSAQIFADFAGYSLIAMGLAALLGYRLPINFNFPYMASSIADFWRRWHISLSSFLRDYLYIPLGGSRKGGARTYINLIIVMGLGGLWHGAAWSFAVWGLWHGVGLALERPWLGTRFMESRGRLAVGVRIVFVFLFVTLGWLLFKLQHFSEALTYLQALFQSPVRGMAVLPALLIALYGSAVPLYHLAHAMRGRISGRLRDAVYGTLLFLVLTSAGPAAPFIYFQF